MATPESGSLEDAEYHTATVGGDGDRYIAYREYGNPGGSPVVFLHGTPGSRLLGRLLDTAATERGVRVLAPDRPGYGQSPEWPDRTVRDAAQFVTAVADDVGVGTVGVIGFSGGAPHALATAATRPERVSRVDLVSGATPPAVTERTPPVQRLLHGLATRTPRALGGLLRGQAWLADRLDPAFVVAQYADAETVTAETAAVVEADFREAFAHGSGGAVTELRLAGTEWDVDWKAVEPAVSVWHGADDTNVPVENARGLATALPESGLTVFENVDHLGALRRSVPMILDAHGTESAVETADSSRGASLGPQ